MRSSEGPDPDAGPPSEADVAITARTSTLDPDSCTFTCDRVLHDGEPASFVSGSPAAGVAGGLWESPLAEALCRLDGVASVVVAGTTLTVRRTSAPGPVPGWDVLRPTVAALIRSHVAQRTLVVSARSRTGGSDADQRIAAALNGLLAADINPAIAGHGGRIVVQGVRDGVVSITMQGGCQGCASASATLRQGFESKARLVAPGITAIIDTTDHAAGTSPFYVPGADNSGAWSPLANPVRRPAGS